MLSLITLMLALLGLATAQPEQRLLNVPSVGQLSCGSPGRVKAQITVTGIVPDRDYELRLVLTADGTSLTLTKDRYDAEVVRVFESGTFLLTLTSKIGPGLSLHAVPRTVRVKEQAGEVRATFKAVLDEAPRPGSETEVLTNVEVKCVYQALVN